MTVAISGRHDTLLVALLILLAVLAWLTGCGASGVEDRPSQTGNAAQVTDPAPEALAASDLTSTAVTSWPLFRGDPQATGVAADELSPPLDVMWTFSTEDDTFETSAAIADGTVFAGSLGGNLYAINLADGKEKWSFFSKLGFTAAPAVRNGFVFIGDADGRFYALDAGTGKLQWQFDTEGEISSCANFHDQNVLLTSQDGHLYCLAADGGKLVWKYESGDQIRSFPTTAGGHTFVAGCDGRLHVVELGEGKAVGYVELDGPTGCTAALQGTMAYVGTEGGSFLGIDWRKRVVAWTYQNTKRSTSFRASAAVTPARVLVGARDKQVHCLDPVTGDEQWAFATQGQVDSSAVIAGKYAFVGSGDGRVYAIDVETGQEAWRYEAGGHIVASPAIAAGRLVIGTDAGDLYCFGSR